MKPSGYFSLTLQVATGACLGWFLTACQAPLKASHGYPAGWPQLTRLGEGCGELRGTYANQGIATAPNGGVQPITLVSLIPRDKPLDQHAIRPGASTLPESVTLAVLPATRWQPYPKLQATIKTAASIEAYEVGTASRRNALLYVLRSSGSSAGALGFSSSQSRVFLTQGGDGSLIAKIHTEEQGMILVIPAYSGQYTWARFERIGD